MNDHYTEYSTEGIGRNVFLAVKIGKFRPLKLDFTQNVLEKIYQVINDFNLNYLTEEIRQTTLERPKKGYFLRLNTEKCHYLETERSGGGTEPPRFIAQ